MRRSVKKLRKRWRAAAVDSHRLVRLDLQPTSPLGCPLLYLLCMPVKLASGVFVDLISFTSSILVHPACNTIPQDSHGFVLLLAFHRRRSPDIDTLSFLDECIHGKVIIGMKNWNAGIEGCFYLCCVSHLTSSHLTCSTIRSTFEKALL